MLALLVGSVVVRSAYVGRGRLGGAERERRRARARRRAGLRAALLALLEATITPGAGIATLVVGVDADAEVTRAAETWLDGLMPEIEVEVLDGGQPLYPYLVGVE